MDKRLLTIQDISCVGQCSLTVALPVISACGIETAILPGAVLSNHTAKGFSGWSFTDLTENMKSVLEYWNKNKISFDAFYTGYVSKAQIPVILSIMEQTAREGALRIVDPVMADNGKLYAGFDEDFPEEMKKLCSGADVILPNITEASLLLGKPYVAEGYTKEYIEDMCRGLYALGAKNVILTGVSLEPQKVGVAVYDGKSFGWYFTQCLGQGFHGTGDIFASVVAGSILRGKTPLEAATLAADFVVKAISNTMEDKDHWYGVKFEKVLPDLIVALK